MPAWSKYASINDADLEQIDKIRQAVRGSDAQKFVTNEVASSVPPVPPAIWADWNKDDTLLGGGSLPHVTLLGNCAQEQHRRIRNPLPANEQRPSEVLRGMLPQHAAHGRACGNLRHTPTLPTSTTSYYATLLRGQQRFQWLRQFCQTGEL